MTPEEIAKDICSRIPRPGLVHLDWLEEQVCTAIRDAYERAALTMDGLAVAAHAEHQRVISEGDVNEALGYGYERAASSIRALKGPS